MRHQNFVDGLLNRFLVMFFAEDDSARRGEVSEYSKHQTRRVRIGTCFPVSKMVRETLGRRQGSEETTIWRTPVSPIRGRTSVTLRTNPIRNTQSKGFARMAAGARPRLRRHRKLKRTHIDGFVCGKSRNEMREASLLMSTFWQRPLSREPSGTKMKRAIDIAGG